MTIEIQLDLITYILNTQTHTHTHIHTHYYIENQLFNRCNISWTVKNKYLDQFPV